ncbi:MAG TPA: 50S ribosomal protein L23 [Planctomycetaceae bacterium]|jgi:large subunit ribosomal protein L23|uniref:Large ribosomal subunit protein uL23 n=1 Tax=Gimesia maris TaxID=122 RepID=A0A3D3R2L0_9PLAN|nr:50S ribosomal protein L23 [Gimesia sp.]HAW27165.1 50S ribosomal protein L23 [Planctomycetaceae bacterium]HCO23101.1 50S ribosomal protein L23 [Gimesia maris]|tara:strand:- start:102305 stop:102613 length:309 start_codon:yes stop_codon:yes gene_type:complete
MSDGSKKGVQLEPYQVVIRPLVTEKGTHLSESFNAYTFVVDKSATKTDIKKAVSELWNVRVVGVRTQNRGGKPRRHKYKVGYTKSWKKAIVELHEDDRISFF